MIKKVLGIERTGQNLSKKERKNGTKKKTEKGRKEKRSFALLAILKRDIPVNKGLLGSIGEGGEREREFLAGGGHGQRRERAGAAQQLRGWGCRRRGPPRAAVYGPFLPRCGAPKGPAAAADKARGGGRRPAAARHRRGDGPSQPLAGVCAWGVHCVEMGLGQVE